MDNYIDLKQHIRNAYQIQHQNKLPLLCITEVNNQLFIANSGTRDQVMLMLSDLLKYSHCVPHNIVRAVCVKLGITDHVDDNGGLEHMYAVIDNRLDGVGFMGVFSSYDVAMAYACQFGFSVDVVDIIINCGLYDK